jgi:2-hydroxy-6-oxonona-2,4-dienedioate hydrolase
MTFWLDLAGTPYSLGWVDAGGVRTRSLQAGHGHAEHVVFLHGTSGHLEAFVRNIPAHARHFHCHAIDMLGHGFTGKPPGAYVIPRYAEHLAAYLDASGLGRVHLVGESLGGWVAAWFAAEAPGRVASLQLLAAGGTKADPAVMNRIRESTTAAVQRDDIGLTRSRLELLMHDPAHVSDELVALRHTIYHQPDFAAALDDLLCLQDMRTRRRYLLDERRLARIACPTLVVWGRQNPFGDVPEAEQLARWIPGSRLELLDACGHWPQHERHETYNPMSLEFLASCRDGTR